MYGSLENEATLREAEKLQEKTKQSLANIQGILVDTDEVATNTQEELQNQSGQIKKIDEIMDTLNSGLDRTKSLLNTFDRWLFRRTNDSEVAEDAKSMLQEASQTPLEEQELFEHQRYDPGTRKWKEPFLLQDPEPFVYLNGKPATERLDGSRWKIEFKEQETDPDGWTYGFDFPYFASGSSSKICRNYHFVRRRKWKYYKEDRSEIVVSLSTKYQTGASRPVGVSSLVPSAAQESNTRSVPGLRVRVPIRATAANDHTLTRTMLGKGPRKVDTSDSGCGHDRLTAHERGRLARVEDTDREIDSTIEHISGSVDRLHSHARNFNEEIKTQNASIAVMENKMDTAHVKLAEVNARMRKNGRL